jgi:phospholipid/cholesterol/gamma-HCH transport system ATP-binding protein
MKPTASNTEPAKKNGNSEHPVIEIRHLKKSFGDNQVLKDISLDLKKGENLVVMGKSGTGKSVLIKCIVSLIDFDKGHITVLGKSIDNIKEQELNEVRKKIGFLFQSAALYDSMTVRQNLEFPLRDNPLPAEETEKKVKEALENVGLQEAIDKMPAELSGGMRKRVGLARTLILNPEIILYDEPNTGLDPITSREISLLIVDVQKKYGTSALIITHDIDCARITGNRIIIIDQGVCIAEGTFEELQNSDNELVRSFLNNDAK